MMMFYMESLPDTFENSKFFLDLLVDGILPREKKTGVVNCTLSLKCST